MLAGNFLKKIFFWLMGMALSGNALAQQFPSKAYIDSALFNTDFLKVNCATDLLMGELRKKNDYVALEKKMNETIARKVQGFAANVDSVVLPLVFHIIGTNPALITDAQIQAAVKDLNDAFGKRGAYAASKGADTKIRFALAKRDPEGGNTKGINRVTSYYGSNLSNEIEDTRLKNLIQWDPVKYINIWLVSNIVSEISAEFSCGVWTRMNTGGYATLPTGAAGTTDGIVVSAFGVMLAHEMGHYLGLYHTFEGGCTNNDCTKDGDRVCDTPPDGTTRASPNCNAPTNSCVTDTLSNYSNGFFPRDTTDQIANFMDYSNSLCSNQFTLGQADRMQTAILTQRAGLMGNALVAPCAENSVASFTRDVADPKTGDLINFTNTSTNATSYQWLLNNVIVATTPNYSTSSLPLGKSKITLKAFNADPTCFASATDYVITNCGVAARYYYNKKMIASKANVYADTILFTNTSVGATSYQWVISNANGLGRNIVTSNAAGGGVNDLNYVFQDPGNYQIKLIASNGSCIDSTSSLFIPVLDPTPDAFISIANVNCYQETKVRVQFYVCSFSYSPVPKGLPISFYDADPRLPGAKQIDNTILLADSVTGYCCGKLYTQILDVKYRKLNQIFAVINDAGTTSPLTLPNTGFLEREYKNNVASFSNFKFTVTPVPSVATIEPGDTLQLSAQTSPDPSGTSTYLWSSASRLNCTACRSPFFIADTLNAGKQVIATSQYQCFDTAQVSILVPPANDYTVTINAISCSPKEDSLVVDFTLKNLFKRGIIPKNLPVAFYKNDPSVAGATLLPALFKTPDSVSAKQQVYKWKIKKTNAGKIYASVNDNGTQFPIIPGADGFSEKDYTNNFSFLNYQPLTAIIDSTICSGDTLYGYSATGNYTDVLQTPGGCDSIRVLRLTVRTAAIARTTVTVNLCEGQTYLGYTKTGTYIDVFKGVNACDSIRTLVLKINPVPNITKTVQICRGNTYLAGGKLQTQSGTYRDTVKTAQGCDSITTTILAVTDPPARFLPADTLMCLDKPLVISLNYPTVTWSDGTLGNTISITQPGNYVAQVTDRNGCNGADTIQVSFQKCIPIQIPSAFTPNGDGKNDKFKPLIPVPLTSYSFQIYNRWGQVIFETKKYNEGWNGNYKGEQQPNGAYVYFISFSDDTGATVVKKGTLLLIR